MRNLLAVASVLAVWLTLSTSAYAQSASVTVQLAPQNASGVSGTAVLTDLGGGRTRVQINVTPATGDHPAHIHMGSCDNLNPAPEYPLANVQNGTSTTEVNAALATLQGTQRAINLHLSADQINTYVACGNLPLAGTQGPAAVPAPQPPAAPRAPVNLPNTGELNTGSALPLIGAGAVLLLLGAALELRRRTSVR